MEKQQITETLNKSIFYSFSNAKKSRQKAVNTWKVLSPIEFNAALGYLDFIAEPPPPPPFILVQ